MWEGFLMGMVPGKEIHNKSTTHSSDFNDQPVWLGGTGKDTVPFSSVMQKVERDAKIDHANDHSNYIAASSYGVSGEDNRLAPIMPVFQGESGKFEKILATLDVDEIKTLRKIKIDAIRDAMNSGDQDALHKAQSDFKACSQVLRLRASTLGLTSQPGISIITSPINSTEQHAPSPVNKPQSSVESPITSKSEVVYKNKEMVVSNNKGSESEQVVNIQTISAINLSGNTMTNNIIPDNTSASYPIGNNRFGVSPIVWEAVQKNDFVKNTLLTFPLEAVDMYKTTNFDEKRLLFEQLQEKTKVMFVTVDHREAFIKGSAYGHNTFDFFKSKIEDEVKAGKLAKDAAGKRLATVEVFREMSQEQRKAFVDLLELDMKMAKI